MTELFQVAGLHARPATEQGATPGDEILKGLDLTVRAGEVHAIMGPNGCGKSTLGNTLLGSPEYEVTAGSIRFHGDNVTDWPSDERAKAVDLSDGYYDLNQAVVALIDSPAAAATSIADLKAYTFGAQVGTTSYDAIENVIDPTPETQVFNDNAGAIQALQSKLIDAIVVDLPTADFITRVQVVDADFNPLAKIVGQLAPAGGTQEYFSLALGKDSPLTPCLNEALGAHRADDTLDALASTWLPFQEDVPVLP